MATKITIDNTSGNINYESSPIVPQIYDLAGELSGTPPVSTRVFDFKAVKAFTLKTGGVAGCVTAPSGGSVQFTIEKEVISPPSTSSIGTITFADGATAGTVSIASDVSIAINNIIKITSPANVYSIDTVFWTFNGVCP